MLTSHSNASAPESSKVLKKIRLLGLCFGTLKVTAILTSIYIYNLGFLDTKQWWLDSLTREYTIKFSESVEPILKDWEIGTSTFSNNSDLYVGELLERRR